MYNWLTVEEAAKRLSINYSRVSNHVCIGKIPSLKMGRTRRVAIEVIEHLTGSPVPDREAPEPMRDWMPIADVAKRWRMSSGTVRKAVAAGTIPVLRIASIYRISREVVEEIELEARTFKPRPRRKPQKRKVWWSGIDFFPGV